MTNGERIKERRKQLGTYVDMLAEKLGKNRATIYRYESSDIEKLPTTVLEPLAEALRTTPAYLMGWTSSEEDLYGDIIRKTRENEGLSQEEFAKILRIDVEELQKYESNELQPSEQVKIGINALIHPLSIKTFKYDPEDYKKIENRYKSAIDQLIQMFNLKGLTRVFEVIEDYSKITEYLKDDERDK